MWDLAAGSGDGSGVYYLYFKLRVGAWIVVVQNEGVESITIIDDGIVQVLVGLLE